jgi:ABC-type transporter Mla subunit MlaD
MAQRKQHNELAAGVAVIAGLAATVGVVLWLGAASIFAPTRQRAHFYIDESAGPSGLAVGDYLYAGSTEIGRVSHSAFDAATGRTTYVAEVKRPGVTIRADAVATVERDVFGKALLVITSRGTPGRPPANADHPVPLRKGGLFENLGQVAQKLNRQMHPTRADALLAMVRGVVQDLQAASGAVKRLLVAETDPNRAESMLAMIRRSVADINAVTAAFRTETDAGAPGSLLSRARRSAADVNAVTASARAQADPNDPNALLAKVHRTMDHVNDLSADVTPKLRRTMTHVERAAARLGEYMEFDVAEILIALRQTSTKILKLSRDLAELSGEARDIVVLNRENIDEMIDNMAAVSADLKATAKEIRRNPWRIFHRPEARDIETHNVLQATRAFSNGAEQLDQALAKLKAVDPEVVDPEDVRKIRRHLQETFEKFSKVEQRLWKELLRQSS